MLTNQLPYPNRGQVEARSHFGWTQNGRQNGRKLLETGVRLGVFTEQQAETAGKLWTDTRRLGPSLGDCACLSVALEGSLSILTANRTW